MQNIHSVKDKIKKAIGKKEYVDFLSGKKLTPLQVILADCYSCTAHYADGKVDCESQYCTLYQFMPYRTKEIKEKRTMTEKQQESYQKMAFIRSGGRKTSEQEQLIL